jgi:hypothetical protein
MSWYILERDGDYKVAYCNNYNPLYGRGSWNLVSGPFASYEEAEAACPA